jgi:hypothetical protein
LATLESSGSSPIRTSVHWSLRFASAARRHSHLAVLERFVTASQDLADHDLAAIHELGEHR